MIRENKLKYIISLIVIIIPSVVALCIKDSVSNMMKGAWYFTWLLPIVLALLHTGLLILTRYIDPVKQTKKIENIIFFIIPALTLYAGSIFIALMLGFEFNINIVCALLLGIGLIVIGNYMPKAKRNRTFGIKLRWTVSNDDNWVATHRLGGKVFAIAGALVLACGFLPANLFFIALIVILAAVVIVPTVYSYCFYKKQIAGGEASEDDYSFDRQGGKKTAIIITVVMVAVVLLVCVLMFVGDIKFEFGEDALTVDPNFGGGIELNYSELSDAKIEYRESKVPGTRVMGYASTKLLFGQFNNSEFGNYTRYTYTKSDHAIVIHLGDDVIVIAAKTSEDTYAIYQRLLLEVANAD